jgi:hypothetical protein
MEEKGERRGESAREAERERVYARSREKEE